MQTGNEIEQILAGLRKKRLPEGSTAESLKEIIVLLAEEGEPEEAEKALLALYYLWVIEGDPLRNELLAFCSDPLAEEDPLLRGRKLWILLRLFFSEKDYQAIHALLERAGRVEVSGYVWERILAVLGDEDEVYRFYPEPVAQAAAIQEGKVEGWSDFVGRQEEYLRYAARVARHCESGLPGWIEGLCRGTMNEETVYSHCRVAGSSAMPFPLPAESFRDLYHTGDACCRMKLLKVLEIYLGTLTEDVDSEQDEPLRIHLACRAASTAYPALKSAPPLKGASEPFHLFEKACVITLGLIQSGPGAFEAAIDFLKGPFADDTRSPELFHDLQKCFGPHLLRLAGDKRAPEPGIRKASDLLSDESAYLQQLGASILLQAARSGYRLEDLLPLINEAYRRDSATSNAFATGKDIQEEEKTFSCTLPSIQVFNLEKEEQEEDGFMNLRNLTGLLEMCQPPATAFRLQQLIGLFNTDSSTSPFEAATRAVLGPMSLVNAVDFICSATSLEELRQAAQEKGAGLVRSYRERLSIKRREMIRSVFEGDPAETPGLYPQVWEQIEAEGGNWPDPFSIQGAEETFDALAWYLPSLPLPQDRKGYSGIYFHADTILSFAKKHNLPLEDLLYLTAVHELFHFFCEQRTGSFHSHAGEDPEYCTLEEAGADRAAFDWGNKALGRERILPFLDNLLVSKDRQPLKALPGYGEYHLLDEEAPGWVPLMLSPDIFKDGSHPGPGEYAHQRLLLANRHQDRFETGRLIWKGMMESIREGASQLCWFVDLR